MTTVINGTSTSASAPAVVGDDGDTGVYFPSANTLALSAGGTQVSTINAYGIGLGAGTTPSSGMGITFPASQSSSSNANTLDDYEEGTFTVQYLGGSSDPSVVYDFRQGVYTKIGNLVAFAIRVGVSTSSSGSGTLRMSLPFTASVIQECSAVVGLTYNWGATVPLNALIETGTSSMVFYKSVNSSNTVNVSDLGNSSRLWITGTYYTS